MKINSTPNEKIHNLICEKLLENSELKMSLNKLNSHLDHFGFETWTYVFRSEGSPVEVSLHYSISPSGKYLIQCSIVKTEKEWFSIEDYLTFIKNSELKDFIKSSDESEYVADFLTIVTRHLCTGLKDVVLGREWIQVPFDWSIADGYK